MNQHTPGPWKLHSPDSFFDQHSVPKNANFFIEFGPGDYGGFWVVEHSGIDRTKPIVTRTGDMADGHLITAAPDLLEACKAALSLFALGVGGVSLGKHTEEKDRCISEAREILNQLNAAIAKAEGGTQ